MSENTRTIVQKELRKEFNITSGLISSIRRDESGRVDENKVLMANKTSINITEHIQGIIRTGKATETEIEEMNKMASKLSDLMKEKAKELGRESGTEATSNERIAMIKNNYGRMFEAETVFQSGRQEVAKELGRIPQTVAMSDERIVRMNRHRHYDFEESIAKDIGIITLNEMRRKERQKELWKVSGYEEPQKKKSKMERIFDGIDRLIDWILTPPEGPPASSTHEGHGATDTRRFPDNPDYDKGFHPAQE